MLGRTANRSVNCRRVPHWLGLDYVAHQLLQGLKVGQPCCLAVQPLSDLEKPRRCRVLAEARMSGEQITQDRVAHHRNRYADLS